MKIGYARVSTDDQKNDMQLDALKNAGVETVFADTASGADKTRPSLKACLQSLKAGDTLVVWKLDRLARSLTHLVEIIDDLHDRKVEFVSIMDVIDTHTAMGRAMFQITGVFAELERNVIRERTKAGLAAARRRGVRLGPKPQYDDSVVMDIENLRLAGKSCREVEEITGVSRSTVSRLTKNLIESQDVEANLSEATNK